MLIISCAAKFTSTSETVMNNISGSRNPYL